MFYRGLFLRSLVILLAISMLSACGGGGDGDNGSAGNGDITLSPGSVTFTAEQNGSLPSSQFVSVAFNDPNTAGILVGWPNETGFVKPSWMSITSADLTGSSSPLSLRLRVNTTNLSPGTYSTRVRVVTGDTNQRLLDTKDIAVSYIVRPEIVLSASPASLSFNQTEGISVAQQTIALSVNSGSIPVWSSSITYTTGANWLTLTTPSNNSSSFTVGIDPQLAGTYQATIKLFYTIAGVSKQLSIPVTYTATSIATVSSNNLVFNDTEGNLPAAQSVVVSFDGGTTPAWNAIASYVNGDGWLNLTQSGNSLEVQPSLLLPGTYRANITINYTTALGVSSKLIPVSYTISEGVSVSQSSLVINAIEGETPASIPLVVNYSGSGTLSWSSSVSYINGSGWLNLSPTSGATLPATINADLSPLVNGVYEANITIQYSYGNINNSKVIPVRYSLASAWVIPQEISFTLDSSTIAADLQQIVSINDSNTTAGVNLNWNATTSKPWISISPASGDTATNNQLIVSLVSTEVAKLAGGNNTTTITLTPNEANVSPAQITVNLINKLPVVNYVAPYVAYTNTIGSDYVIIRGQGFAGITQDVKFGTELATNVNVVSDTELHVTPPVLTAGKYAVYVSNPLAIELTQADLVVKEPTSFSNQTVTTNFGSSNKRIIYDAERDLVFESRCYFCGFSSAIASKIIKYQFNTVSNLWEYTLFDYPSIVDISLTPDGKELLVLTSTQLLQVDPDTMTTNKAINLAFNPVGTTYQMAVLNSGMVLFRSGRATYNLIDGSFGTLEDLGGLRIDTSPDGSRAVGGSADNSGSKPFKYYDASTNTVITTNAFYYYVRGMMDTHATRLFSSGNIFDADFNLLGTLNASSQLGTISPDGQLVYGSSGTQINVFDLTGLSPFSVMGTLTAEEPGQMVMSPDGNTLFSVGANYFMVRDVSTVVPVQ